MDKPIPEAVVFAAKQAAYAADPETVLTTAATRAALTAAQQQGQAVAAQAEQSDRRTFPMGYDSHLHGLVTDNVASALLCCGIENLPAGVLDTIASEIVRGYHGAPLTSAEAQGGGEVMA